MKPCISEATTMPCSFAEDVANFADAGWPAMEVWLTKLENHLETHSVSDIRKMVDDRQMTLAAASYQGGLLLSQGEQRKAHYDHFRRRLDLCQQLGVGKMLVAADFAGTIDQPALERAVISLKQAAQWAGAFGVQLAIEFRGMETFCRSLDTALALIKQASEPNVGVNLDVFHYYTGPSKLEDLDLLTPQTLAFVQVCDVSGIPREFASDADRVLPGDGDWRLELLIRKLSEIGYDGWVSLELMNLSLWKTKPAQVASVGFSALRRLLGAASQG